MMSIKRILLLFFLMFFVFTGCSYRGNNPVDNPLPEGQNNVSDELPVAIGFDGFTGIGLLGAYNLSFSPDNLNVELVPIRSASIGESYIVNGESYFSINPCTDCLTIKSIGLRTLSGQVEITFSFSHPFEKGDPALPPSGKNRLDLDIFDPILIFKINQPNPTFFPLSNINIHNGIVLNADGYTTELANLIGNMVALPFIRCSYAQRFKMGEKDYLSNAILHADNLDLDLFLTFSYGVSAKFQDRLNPIYYVPEFNRKAAAYVHVYAPTWRANDTFSEYPIYIYTFDQNHGATVSVNYPDKENPNHISAPSDIESVTVEIPGMVNHLVEAKRDATYSGSSFLYKAWIANENGLQDGTYTGLVKVLDSRVPEESLIGYEPDTLLDVPDGVRFEWHEIPEFATYQTFTVKVNGTPLNPSLSGMFYPWLGFSDAVSDGTRIFSVLDVSGFSVIDLSVPESPKVVGSIPTNPEMSDTFALDVRNNLVAAITWNLEYLNPPGQPEKYLKLIDVSDPANPSVLGGKRISLYAQDVRFLDDLIFVISGWHMSSTVLSVFDTVNPSDPNLLCQSVLTGAGFQWIVPVDPTHLIVDPGIILDVTDPCNPQQVGSINSGWSTSLSIFNNIAYIGIFDGISIIDISDILHPQNLGVLTGIEASNFYLKDGYLFAQSENYDGVLIIDVSDPSDPELITTIPFEGEWWWLLNIFVKGDYLYYTNDNLDIYDISDPSTPLIVKSFGNFYFPGDMALKDDHAFVSHHNGIAIFDVSSADNPQYLNSFYEEEKPEQLEIGGNYLYVGLNDSSTYEMKRLQIIDISDPIHPDKVFEAFISFYDFAVDGDYFYLSQTGALRLYDVSNPSSPQFISLLSGKFCSQIALDNGFVYFISWGYPFKYLNIYDISDPLAPWARGSCELNSSYPIDLAVDDGIVSVMASEELVEFYDARNPDDPKYASNYSTEYISSIAVDNGHAYITDESGLLMLDITDPATPNLSETFNAVGYYIDVEVRDNFAYLPDYIGGFAIVELW